MLSSHVYSKAVDVWSLGCTFAEILTKNVFFKAGDYIKQIKIIFETLGMPPEEDLKFITNQKAKSYVESLKVKDKCSLKKTI